MAVAHVCSLKRCCVDESGSDEIDRNFMEKRRKLWVSE